MGGQIYIFGGQTPEGATNKVERFNPLVNKWLTVEDMTNESSGATTIKL